MAKDVAFRGVPYAEQWILFWNTASRLIMFSLVAWLITEVRMHLRREEQLARTDALTGLPNRALFVEELSRSMRDARRAGQQLALLFVDLDHFKIINDTLGHDAGDLLLKQLSTTLRDCLRQSDLVARLGGDEFAVLLPQIDADDRQEIVARLEGVFAHPFKVCGVEVAVRGSVGSVQFPDAEDHDLDGLLRIADADMYARKHAALESGSRAAPSSLDLWAEAVRSAGPPPEQR